MAKKTQSQTIVVIRLTRKILPNNLLSVDKLHFPSSIYPGKKVPHSVLGADETARIL